ncbi:hypothetical protein PCANC_17390 [Puccinia coronata f. sp. avenae]|uniref:DUF654-domain-containing protein n=1 Tax=Puccinia coronata f. sp. avenae TaxID=200324 RepID=A0A2N5V006_9BASI|nr:hypothetical protein PCANC_17390 [Puccinia coronata f. sp. avenae]
MGRSSKRQQREDQELQLLTTTATIGSDVLDDEDEETAEALTTGPSSGRKNLFNSFNSIQSTTGLEDEEEEEADEDENEKSVTPRDTARRKKPKKKKNRNKTTTALDHSPPTTTKNTSNNKNEKASSHSSNEKRKALNTGEVDEIDQALLELSKKLQLSQLSGDADHPRKTVNEQQAMINDLLKVDPKMIDPELELRRMFGAKVVSSSGSTMSGLHGMYGPRIINDPHHQLNSKLKMRATLLSKPEPSWPPYSRATSGLILRRLAAEEVAAQQLAGEDAWFRFEHSASFKLIQSRFLGAIMSLDPNQLVTILQRAPYHADTLLQLSEVAAHNEDQGQAVRFLNQALFVSEKTLASSFFSSGASRLDYRQVENRSLFRALDRKLLTLLKQGCYRSSFQTCKFLFSLNPYQDPFASLLWLDFLAPKASQDQFLIDLVDHLAALQNRDPNGGIYTEAYPGLYYAKALCLRAVETKNRVENHDPSDFALESAILRFPQVITLLAPAIGLFLPASFERIARARVEEGYTKDGAMNMLHLKARIYVHRSSSLWKVAEASAWLRQMLERAVDKLSQSHDPDVELGSQFITNDQLHSVAAEGIYRAALVSDIQAFKNFLPPWVYSRSANAFSFDPLPPEGGTSYDAEYFKNSEEVAAALSEVARRRGLREGEEEEEEEEDDDDDEVILPRVGVDHEAHEMLEALFADTDNAVIPPDQLDRVVQQLQLIIQLDHDQLLPLQRQALLERLDQLFDLGGQMPPPQPHQEDPPDDHRSTSDQDDNDDSQDDDTDPRMPGAF